MHQESKISRFVPRLLPALLYATLATAAFAHDTWLVAERYTLPAGGDDPRPDERHGLPHSRLRHQARPRRPGVGPAGRQDFGGQEPQIRHHSLLFSTPLPEPGIATVWVELAPKSLDLTPDQVKEYLDEIGASPEIRRAYEAAPEPRRWREVYAKHAKTFVRVGQPQEDRSWAEPVGMDLEIVPEKDPSTLKAGDDFTTLTLVAR